MIVELKDRTGQQMISFILPNIVGFQKSGGGTLIYTSSNRDFQSENTYEEVKSKINETTRNNNNDWYNSYGEVDDFLFDELNEKGFKFPILEDNDKPELNTIEAIKLLLKMQR